MGTTNGAARARRSRWRGGSIALGGALSGALSVASSLAAADRYVSPSGNDANPGTLAQPWKTIQHAATVATPGTTVNVRAGVYAELVTVGVNGNAVDGPVTFRPAPGEAAIMDGATLTVPNADTGFFFLPGSDWITIEGFEFRSLTTSNALRTPMAIHVRGAAEHVTIRNNLVHDIATTNVNGNAHGIAVYADAAAPTTFLVITGNEIRTCLLGSSEALAINGNVDGFLLESNHVHDCNNIGIVMIGGEGTGPTPAVDRARNGVVRLNLVHHIDSLTNPPYNGERSAGGIYVDGGCCITIDRNTIHHANLGIELASEHAGWNTESVVATNNVIFDCHVAGIALGGYDTTVGGTALCTIVNNTCYRNDTDATGSGELMLQSAVQSSIIRNNIFAAGPQALVVANAFAPPTGTVIDDNHYHAPGGAAVANFLWNNVDISSFAAWKAATGQDAHTGFSVPQFVSTAATPDLHLKSVSPCIDKGIVAAVPAGITRDRDGLLRVAGASVDRGAYEFGSVAVAVGDLNADGQVDAADLAMLLGSWGACLGCPADLDGDGAVGGSDLAALLGAWG